MFRDWGFQVWFDQDQRETTLVKAMLEGVKTSKVFLVYVRKDVFTRPTCLGKARKALELKRKVSFNAFAEMKSPLFDQVESIPFDGRSLRPRA
jgi:hypothetical protein